MEILKIVSGPEDLITFATLVSVRRSTGEITFQIVDLETAGQFEVGHPYAIAKAYKEIK